MYLADILSDYSLKATFYGSIILLTLIFFSLAIKPLSSFLKKMLFISIVSIVASITLFLGGTTIYLNVISVSNGPVHYHADIEIWACGEEIDLKDPKGLSNKIGTPILHEHNDKRIHLEGVVVEEKDQSLGRFFEVIGGYINTNSLLIPTNQGSLILNSDNLCPDNQNTGILQVFVYKVKNNVYYQTKIQDPQNYIISPQTNVPPADCIIIEFDSPKEKTDKLCRSFKVAETVGKLKGETNYGH